jgi:hypothetical protein
MKTIRAHGVRVYQIGRTRGANVMTTADMPSHVFRKHFLERLPILKN